MVSYLSGDVTRLRPLRVQDLPSLEAWDGDPEIVQLMGKKFSSHTPPEEWYRRVRAARHSRALAIETLDGRLVGEVELEQINWRTRMAEVRILIGRKEFRGRGLGSDALQTALRLAFDRLGLKCVYLRVFASNRPAIRCYERLGFVTKGRLSPSRRRGDRDTVLLMVLSAERFSRVTDGDAVRQRMQA